MAMFKEFTNATYVSIGLNSSKNIDTATLNCNVSSQDSGTSVSGCQMKTGGNNWQTCTLGQSIDLSDGYDLYYSLNLTTGNVANKIDVDWCKVEINEVVVSASETIGDDAIERAINSSLSGISSYSNQQVYIRYLDSTQNLSRFDWFVVQTSPQKRWALNYITAGDPTSSRVNGKNISSTFYMFEIESMTHAAITDAVGDMLNATKN